MLRPGRQVVETRVGTITRPHEGFTLASPVIVNGTPLGLQTAWISNGGPSRAHPYRSNPFTLEIPRPEFSGTLRQVRFLGVFALWAARDFEAPGTVGATFIAQNGDVVVHRLDLLNARHYFDAAEIGLAPSTSGDGLVREPVGSVTIDGREHRVDLVTIDIPDDVSVDVVKLRDMGSAAAFAVFDVLFVYEPAAGCPFHSKRGGVPLADLGAIIRVGDRQKLQRAIGQLSMGILEAADLDEARGLALTFIAVLTAATLELGGSREMHRVQLESARKLDRLISLESISEFATQTAEAIVEPLFAEVSSPSGHLVDRALAYVDRHFAEQISDADMAQQLGLSTSHFRFLFKEATGQPFHKYLISTRLERARRMLIDQGLPVSEIARAVGFSNASHFSRAFLQRFQVNPAKVRQMQVDR